MSNKYNSTATPINESVNKFTSISIEDVNSFENGVAFVYNEDENNPCAYLLMSQKTKDSNGNVSTIQTQYLPDGTVKSRNKSADTWTEFTQVSGGGSNSPYNYKGIVDTLSKLPTSDQTVGDYYVITTASTLTLTIDGSDKVITVDSGDSVVWNGKYWDVIKTESISDPVFADYTLNSVYSGTGGLAKFSFRGVNAKVTPEVAPDGYVRAYYYMAGDYKGVKPELPHSNSRLLINNKEVFSLGSMCGMSGTYKYKGVNYEHPDVYDEYTDNCLIQRISDEWYPKADYISEDLIQLNAEGKGTNNVLFELRIPEKAFGEQIPYKNTADDYVPFVCPMARGISETHIVNHDLYDNYYNQFMSFAWHEGNSSATTDIEKSGYYSLHFCSRTDGSTKKALITKLFQSKWFIRYTLAEPIYKYNTGKIYLKDNDVVSVSDDNESYKVTCNYIKVPSNLSSQLSAISALTDNINELNDRIENVKVGDQSFGYPDGDTDNYDYIMSLLDANKNSGVDKIIDIPSGTYYLSKPVVLNIPHTTIRGNGHVVIKCPDNAPAFVIASNYTTIEGFTFQLSKVEDTATAELDDGHHSAIYIDAGIGLYNNKILNCDFQGAYRLSTKNIERTYGIYFAKAADSIYTPNVNGFSYFNIIDNCRFYSVYCGLYLPYGSQPAKVWFSFDRGDDPYGIPGVSGNPHYNTLGCGYGCICEGSTNFIRFDGQFIGEDHTNPTNPVFETVDGAKKAVSATINNVSVCAVKCSGTMNYLEGFAYDVQRCDKGYVWFAEGSKNNMYSLLNFGTLFGSPYGMTFEDTYTVYDTDNKAYELKMSRNHPYITDDSGLNKFTFSPLRYQHDLFLNSDSPIAVGPNGVSNINAYPVHFGMQDNALAYLDKWGGHGSTPAIKCYRIVDGKEVTEKLYNKDPNSSDAVETDVSQLFSPYSAQGWSSGLTFEHTPTADNPIYIKLIFNQPIRIERLMIRFNQYIPSRLSFAPIQSYTTVQSASGVVIQDNNQGQIDISVYHDKNGFSGWSSITGILITIQDALTAGNYNTNKLVGISNIFALASNFGGKSYLPRGGGDVYGDINMNGNGLYLGMVDTLPEPSAELRGCTLLHKGTESDEVKICVLDKNVYVWKTMIQ